MRFPNWLLLSLCWVFGFKTNVSKRFASGLKTYLSGKKGFVLGRKRLFPVCNVFLCSSLRGKERLVSHGQTNSSYRVQTCVFFRPARLFSVFKFLPASMEASKGNGNSVGGCRRVLCRLAFENYLPDWWPQIESIWRVQPCYEVFWSYFSIFFFQHSK
jgi:hypothetical protein